MPEIATLPIVQINENQGYLTFPIVQFPTLTVDSLDDFREKLGQFTPSDIVECSLRDITIDPKDGALIIGGNRYSVTTQAGKSLCKFLKIPFNFGKSLPVDLFDTTVEELKLLKELDVKALVVDGNIIVNFVSAKKNFADNYIDIVQDVLAQNEGTHLTFLSGQINEMGYVLNFLQKERRNAQSINIIDENTTNEYMMGLSISGDIYRMSNFVTMDTLLIHASDDGLATFGDYVINTNGANQEVDGMKFKIASKREVAEGDEFSQGLQDALTIAVTQFNFGKADHMKTVLTYTHSHNLSLWKLFDLRSRLKKVFPTMEQVDSYLMLEAEPLKQIKDTIKQVRKNQPLSKVDLVLKTTATTINAKVIFDGLINYQRDCTLEDFKVLNPVTMSVLFDSYNTRV